MPKRRGGFADLLKSKYCFDGRAIIIIIIFVVLLTFILASSYNSSDSIGSSIFDIFKKDYSFEGKVTKRVSEFQKGKTGISYYLEDNQGKSYRIIDDSPTTTNKLISGTKIKLGKDKLSYSLLTNPTDLNIRKGTKQGYAEYGGIVGTFDTLVILASFNDLDISCTKTQVRNIMFSEAQRSVRLDYLKSSYNTIEFVGDVTDPIKLTSYSSTDDGCSEDLWAYEMEKYARTLGFDQNDYHRVVYVLPRKPNCPILTSELSGRRSWVYACEDIPTYIRGFGRNFGINRALNAPEYVGCCEDNTDSMGSSIDYTQFNPPHVYQMQWLPSYKILSVSSDGLYEISSLDIDPYSSSKPSLIKADCNYYLSYKNVPDGVDPNSGTDRAYDEKIGIYTHEGGAQDTFRHAHLAVGESYYDQVCNQRFTFAIKDQDSVTVGIDVDDGPIPGCLRNTPTLDILPESQIKQPGDSVQYLVKLTDQDTLDCGQTTFFFSKNLDTGLIGQFSSGSIDLQPGQTGETVLTVSSPLTQTDGTYSIQAHSSSNEDPIHDSTDTSLLIIDSIKPTSVQLIVSPSFRYIDLYWTAANDNHGIGKYYIYKDNKLTAETTGNSYRDYNVHGRRELYVYHVVPKDKAGNEGISSNIIKSNVVSASLEFPGEAVGFFIPQCRDGIDNDGDGFCDYSGLLFIGCKDGSKIGDAGCIHQNDNTE